MPRILRRIPLAAVSAVLCCGTAAPAQEPLPPTVPKDMIWLTPGDGVGPDRVRAVAESVGGDHLRLRAWAERTSNNIVENHGLSLRMAAIPWLQIERIGLRIGRENQDGAQAVGVDAAAGPGWGFGWQRARDLRLRWCWSSGLGAEQEAFTNGVANADTMVFELCLRHAIGGGDEITIHGKDFTAIYQVPKGQAAMVARKDPANQLGLPKGLREAVRIPGPTQVGFLVKNDGRWRLQFDRDGDGLADWTLGDSDPDCQPGFLRGPLVQALELVAASPEQTGQITTTRVLLGVGGPVPWRESAARATLVEWLEPTATGSAISPATVRVACATGVRLSATSGSKALAIPLTGASRATVDLPLDPSQPTPLVVESAGDPALRLKRSITWLPTLVGPGATAPLRVVRGQTLLLQSVTGADIEIQGASTRLAALGPWRADQLGQVVLAVGGATRSVTITPCDLPEVVVVGRNGRAMEVVCDRPTADLTWQISNGGGGVEALLTTGNRVRLGVRGAGNGPSTLILSDAEGRELQRAQVLQVGVELITAADKAVITDPILTPHVSAMAFRLALKPYAPGVTVESVAIDATCFFNGDLGRISLTSDGGDATSGEPGMRMVRDENGQMIGVFDYALLTPPWGSWAHRHGITFAGDEPLPNKAAKPSLKKAVKKPTAVRSGNSESGLQIGFYHVNTP